MKRYESSAKTVEEAIEQGLQELGVSIGDVDVQVLEEGSKGLFGLFGSRLAKVSLTVKEEADDLLDDLMPREEEPAPAPVKSEEPKAEKKPEPAKEPETPAAKETDEAAEKAEPAREAEKKEAARPAPVKRVAPKKAEKKPEPEKAEEQPEAASAEEPPIRAMEKPEITVIPEDQLDPESPAGQAFAFLKEITKLMGVEVSIEMGTDAEGNVYGSMMGATIVFQVVGASTYRMAEELNEGDAFQDVVGPLGRPSELTEKTPEELQKMNILFVAGGVGTAPVYPQVKWLKEQGVSADVVQGSKNKDLVILEDEMKAVCGDHLFITTDDGSYGFHGMVTAKIEDLVKNEGRKYDLCVAIGPMIMMKFVARLTKELGIPTIASMNPVMVDGTGMCGACRLLVGGKVKFACVDGPEFDAHEIDFDQAMKRSRMYQTEEGRAFLKVQEGATHHGGCGNCGGEA